MSSFAKVAAEAAGRADWQAIPADRSVWLLTVAVAVTVGAADAVIPIPPSTALSAPCETPWLCRQSAPAAFPAAGLADADAVAADVEAGNDHQSQHDRRGHQAGDRQPGPDRRGDAADRHRGPAHEQTRQGTHATLSAAHDGTARAVLNQPHGMRITLTLPGATS